MIYKVNRDKCRACGICTMACRFGAAVIKDGRAEIDTGKCTDCGNCFKKCRFHAIEKKDTELYSRLCAQMKALAEGVENNISNLANASALLYGGLSDLNWAGFYILSGSILELGPFQGKPACTVIEMGKGVCGTAAVSGSTVRVDDVHQFPGHIACDSASNSEIVIPLHAGGRLIGVLDIDSPLFSRFDDFDKEGLEAFARCIEEIWKE